MMRHIYALAALLLVPLATIAQSSDGELVSVTTADVEGQLSVEVCTTYGPTLEESQSAFSSECPWQVRESCNLLPSNVWACSTTDALTLGARSSESADVSVVVQGAQQTPESSGEQCTVFGATFDDVAMAFSADCPWRDRNVCDVAASGEWFCSTSELVASTSTGANTAADEASANVPLPESSFNPASVAESAVCTSYGESFDAATAGFSAECPWRARNFCDPLASGGWACSTASLAGSTNVLTTPAVLADAADTADTTTVVEVESTGDLEQPDDSAVETVEEPLQVAPDSNTIVGTGVMNSTYQRGDLVIIAHDSGPDTDDMQAIVANRLIIDANSSVNYLMVGATQGHQWTNPTSGSEAHTASLFPNWVNAKASTSGTTSFDGASIITVADRVEGTLDNGGTVHIAEGGPSDFTAEVLRVLQSRGVSAVSLKRIRVVQHSAGSSAWNEQQTSRSNISLVKSAASWVPIANGNVGGNASADFQEPASSSMCQRFRNAAANSRYASQWAWAYSVIDNARKCDQSDSVELLFILNDTSTKTFDQFASRYM